MRAAQIKDKLTQNIPVGRNKPSMVAISELGVAPVKRETVQERIYADLGYD